MLLGIYSAVGAWRMISNFILTTTLKEYHHPHFINEDTEAQAGLSFDPGNARQTHDRRGGMLSERCQHAIGKVRDNLLSRGGLGLEGWVGSRGQNCQRRYESSGVTVASS